MAGIAAADTICASRLGEISRGQDHRQAVALLREVRDTERAARALDGLLDLKDAAHDGTGGLTGERLSRARRAAQLLVDHMESQLRD